jgi:hypothetical protein
MSELVPAKGATTRRALVASAPFAPGHFDSKTIGARLWTKWSTSCLP